MERPTEWSAAEFRDLPHEDVTCDIHCVTKWSKSDARFPGVAVDTLLEAADAVGDSVTAWEHGGTRPTSP